MTFADDFAPLEGDGLEGQSEYPTIFGLSISPTVGGVLLAILGLGGAVALGWFLAYPAWQNLEAKRQERDAVSQQLEQKQNIQAEIDSLNAQLQEVQSQEREILSLFSGEDNLNTLLFDLSTQIQKRQGQILSFQPQEGEENSGKLQVINDGSWGEGVNGKLKTTSFDIEVKGTFNQTLSMLRSIEQLQLLSVVKNFESRMGSEEDEKQAVRYDAGQNKFVSASEPKLRTRFTLQTLVPLSEEELTEAIQAQEQAATETEEAAQE
ncbi:hypothetical protein IQ249_02450 [Lusitaniella coriacea LEGE 07157]|uniref:Type IV pilus assembly protein PilO n=1 Tax=Lusitaniella coriacea LEGE 07157 TaxID=945747 RepID=A0A8J7AXV1_9CYAN|nr:hypothetical protein [Lusitaniella coriacea]MBE9114749.1 hypothetical protein [Lusitaniella coriacea LEGE 07157]